MNKVGIYYAFWTRDWDADFVPFCSKVASLGFDVLEVNAGTVGKMSPDQRKRLKGAADDAGVELTACVGLKAEHDVASPDPAVRKAGVEFLKRQIDGAVETGIREISGVIYGYWPCELPAGETDRTPYFDRSVESMKQAAHAAEDRDVLLSVEVLNRFEHFLLNTAAEGVAYVEAVGSDHCKLLLDTFHMNIEEDDFRDAIATAGDKLGHLHIGETNRRAPGRGRMPWDEIFAALKQVNFTGSIVMEPFLIPGGEVGRDIKIYRDLSDGADLDEEARRSCAFVKRKLA